jgi:hypothetical protein
MPTKKAATPAAFRFNRATAPSDYKQYHATFLINVSSID